MIKPETYLYYNLMVLKRMILPDVRNGGLSSFSRKICEYHIQEAIRMFDLAFDDEGKNSTNGGASRHGEEGGCGNNNCLECYGGG